MKWWESVIHMIGIAFSMLAYIKGYSLIFKNNINVDVKSVFIFILIVFIAYYNTFYNYDFTKIIISFMELLILFKFVFKQNLKDNILKALIMYLFIVTVEMIMGLLMVYFKIDNLLEFDFNVVLKVFFSILTSLILWILSSFKFIKKSFNKLYYLMEKIFNLTILMIIFVIILVMLTYYLILSNDIYSNLSIICLMLILIILIIITMVQSIKTKKAIDKQEILLDFMKEYEIIIDKERIDRHEMVNNLLVLKSIKNKNTKNYEKILDNILLTYQSNKTAKGLYELPSGLKGLFYYKIHDMKNENIEVFINVSNKIIKDLDNLEPKILTKVCKILGILLDNAKEAARESKNKLVVIDLYKENDDINIYIENSINKNSKIDLNKMKVKGFSTKGSNRGYGLYLVDKILGKENRIILNQKIEINKFISILVLKNN